jgi:hypothetical protein
MSAVAMYCVFFAPSVSRRAQVVYEAVVAQVVLDVVFCLEVADGRRVAPAGFVAAVLDAAVDGVRDVVLDVFVDEGFAPLDLAVGGRAGAYGDLHGEDALNRGPGDLAGG